MNGCLHPIAARHEWQLIADFCLSRLTEIDPQATELTLLMGELTLLFKPLGMHCQDR